VFAIPNFATGSCVVKSGGGCACTAAADCESGACVAGVCTGAVTCCGRCNIDTTANTALGTPNAPVLVPGNRTALAIVGCGLKRTTGASKPAFAERSFECGVYTP